MGLLIAIGMGISILLTCFSFSLGVLHRSWKAMLLSSIASLPVSLYLTGVNPPLSVAGILSLLLFSYTFYLKRRTALGQ